jgi:hypothetical protein
MIYLPSLSLNTYLINLGKLDYNVYLLYAHLPINHWHYVSTFY